VEVVVTNGAATDYSLDAAGLNLSAAGADRTADFAIQAHPTNPNLVRAGGTATLSFTLAPTTRAPAGHVTLQVSLFAFDTAFGRNLISNASFERVSAAGAAPPWFFATDNQNLSPEARGAVATGQALTGLRGGEVRVPAARAGDVRSYWDNAVRIQPGRQYLLSGYVKTENVVSDVGNGASIYAPVTGAAPYQEPRAPFIDGTRDWRKAMVAFRAGSTGTNVVAHCRGQLQQGTGIAWFDNFSLTEGPVDASLTVTSPEQSLEVTGG
jgi:hypothetical protein